MKQLPVLRSLHAIWLLIAVSLTGVQVMSALNGQWLLAVFITPFALIYCHAAANGRTL